MLRWFWVLVLPTLLGCSGPIVEEDKKTSVEELQSSMASWCSQACGRLETCHAEVSSDCARDCEEELTEFVRNETCADLALQMQRCIDYSSCRQRMHVEGWPDCYPSKADRDACKQGGEPDSPSFAGSGGESGGSSENLQK